MISRIAIVSLVVPRPLIANETKQLVRSLRYALIYIWSSCYLNSSIESNNNDSTPLVQKSSDTCEEAFGELKNIPIYDI